MTHSPTQQGIVPPVRYRFSFAIETARNLRKTNPALFCILAFTVVTRIVIYTTGQPWNEDVIEERRDHRSGWRSDILFATAR